MNFGVGFSLLLMSLANNKILCQSTAKDKFITESSTKGV